MIMLGGALPNTRPSTLQTNPAALTAVENHLACVGDGVELGRNVTIGPSLAG